MSQVNYYPYTFIKYIHLRLTYLDLHETNWVRFNINICNNLASQQEGVSAKTVIQTVTVITVTVSSNPTLKQLHCDLQTRMIMSDAVGTSGICCHGNHRDKNNQIILWHRKLYQATLFLIRTMIWESEICLYWDRKPVSPLASSLCCSAERLDVNMSPGWAALALFYTTLKKWEFKRLNDKLMLTRASLLLLHVFPVKTSTRSFRSCSLRLASS